MHWRLALEGPPGGAERRCDVWYRKGGKVYVIDVSNVEPCAVACLAKGADMIEMVASALQEKTKQQHYHGCPILAAGGGAVLIPFVVESTGRLGVAARDFYDLITKEQKLFGSLFLDRMSGALARGTGRVVCSARRSLRMFT